MTLRMERFTILEFFRFSWLGFSLLDFNDLLLGVGLKVIGEVGRKGEDIILVVRQRVKVRGGVLRDVV